MTAKIKTPVNIGFMARHISKTADLFALAWEDGIMGLNDAVTAVCKKYGIYDAVWNFFNDSPPELDGSAISPRGGGIIRPTMTFGPLKRHDPVSILYDNRCY